jgi:hypothetical protein
MHRLIITTICIIFVSLQSQSQPYTVRLAVLKYGGGGDWYADPTAVPNLAKFCNEQLGTSIDPNVPYIDVGSPEIFNFPFLHLTGHGNVLFSSQDASNLRAYLLAGGFLHIDDNYGIDQYIRREMKKVFPEYEFVELPFSHPIYHQKFKFSNGLPKIHEHDNKPAQGFGIIHEGRLMVYYSYETDLSDGWEDLEVHNNPPEARLMALQMGANIIQFVFTQ